MSISWPSLTKALPSLSVLSILIITSQVKILKAEQQEANKDIKIIVSANRYETPAERVGGSLDVITSEQINSSQKTNLADLLQEVSGLDLIRSGGRGGNTSVFLRGTNSEHVLVMIDGIELNNPVNNSRSFNLSDLTLDNVERIEILKGPQSSLYGSNAIGGVINIITKSAAQDGVPTASVSAEAGSFGRFTEKATMQYGDKTVNISLGASREDEEGISAADKRAGNTEKDGFKNTSVSLKADITPTEIFKLSNIFRYNDSNTDLDNSGGFGGDDPNRLLENNQLFWRTEAGLSLFEGKWLAKLGFSLADHNLQDENYPDLDHPIDIQESQYKGRLNKIDLINTVKVSDELTLLLGLETEQEKASSTFFSDGAFGAYQDDFAEVSARNNGYFADLKVDFSDLISSSFGFRLDDHNRFGTESTFRVTPLVNFAESGTRIKGSVGTGFKAPTLYQLYSSFGSPDLKPEESIGWEVGIAQDIIDDTAEVGVTYFNQNIDELVTFNSETFVLENVREADIQGIEVFFEAMPLEQVRFRTDYTWLDTEDKDTKSQLLRRAEHQARVRGDYIFSNNQASLGVRARFIGTRKDNDFSTFPATEVDLSGYGVIDLLGSYDLSEEVSLFARVENLFDKDYQDVLGYGTYGVGAWAGVKVTL